MAIRDFGESLLADVRARKDAQARDARKYAKKQQRKELLIAGGAFLGSELFKIGNAAIAQKTQDFLNSSNLYDTKIKVNKAGKLIEEAQGYQNAAKKANTSIYDQFLKSTANTAAKEHQIAKPNAIKDGEVEEYASILMERDEIKALAKEEATYWEAILDKADEYSRGKSKTTLESLASIQQPKSVVGSMWNRITGNENTVDLFNSQMSRLEQVVAATEIDTLTLEKKKKMAETLLKNGGNLSVAKLMIGQELTKEEQLKYKARLKAGEKTEELKQDIAVSSRGVFVTKYEKITEQNGDIRIDQSTVQKLGPNDVLDSSDIVALTGSLDSLTDTVAERFNERGQQDFALKVQEVINAKPKGEQLNMSDVLGLYALSLSPDEFTERRNITTALDPQVQAAIIERTERFTEILEAEMQTIVDSSDPKDVKRTANILELSNSFLSQVVESIRNPENMTDVDSRNEARIEKLQTDNPTLSRERAVEYLKNKGTWNE